MSAKSLLVAPVRALLRATAGLRRNAGRIWAHASFAAQLHGHLPPSVIVMGSPAVHGTGNITVGEGVLLYPDVYLETQGDAALILGASVVLSRGVHLVAMAGVTLGAGCMIGEYASIRDANHTRSPDVPLRDAGHTARPIVLGQDVWIGRGVTVLGGVTIGDRATVGANAVVTRDIPADGVYGGVPARPLRPAGTPHPPAAVDLAAK